MSVLRPGDEAMHYEDGSHRWSPPDPAHDQKAWETRVREHQREHLPRIPKQRVARRSI
jgi:hypothetical protein